MFRVSQIPEIKKLLRRSVGDDKGKTEMAQLSSTTRKSSETIAESNRKRSNIAPNDQKTCKLSQFSDTLIIDSMNKTAEPPVEASDSLNVLKSPQETQTSEAKVASGVAIKPVVSSNSNKHHKQLKPSTITLFDLILAVDIQNKKKKELCANNIVKDRLLPVQGKHRNTLDISSRSMTKNSSESASLVKKEPPMYITRRYVSDEALITGRKKKKLSIMKKRILLV